MRCSFWRVIVTKSPLTGWYGRVFWGNDRRNRINNVSVPSEIEGKMSKVDLIEESASMLADEISAFISTCSFPPTWQEGFGWRHNSEHKEVFLYWLTKLAGCASTINASIKLAKEGYWFQVAILARVITEAHLSIAFTLPRPDSKHGEWPNKKQTDAISNHYKETWEDPERPFENERSRPHIRDLAASVGHFQKGSKTLNPHDATQSAAQYMRYLSDFTHMAYPQIMELLEVDQGYVLNGNQESFTFGVDELGRLLCDSYLYSGIVTDFMKKVYLSCIEKAKENNDAPEKVQIFQSKYESVIVTMERLENNSKKIQDTFLAPDEEVVKVLKKFKKR